MIIILNFDPVRSYFPFNTPGRHVIESVFVFFDNFPIFFIAQQLFHFTPYFLLHTKFVISHHIFHFTREKFGVAMRNLACNEKFSVQ